MTQPLVGKRILVAEDKQIFRSLLDSWFSSLGATMVPATGGVDALELLGGFTPDLMTCDIVMPQTNGPRLLEHIRNRGGQAPVLMISATENMTDIAKALCLGVEGVLLRPVKDLNRLCEMVFAYLYPSVFNSHAEEEEGLFRDWDAMVDNLAAAARLLQGLQPPVQQAIFQCRVNYRQLVVADKPGLVLDIAVLSEGDLASYCFGITRAGYNGVLAALLLRALFNRLLRKQLTYQNQRLPELGALSKQINRLFRQTNLPGQFPLLVGYYHCGLKNLILVSTGLNATLNTSERQMQISNGVSLGTLGNAYLSQLSQRCDAWQRQIWGTGGRLRSTLPAE